MHVYVLIALISFIASALGAVCGIGGGVIIKPALDAAALFDVPVVSFLSGVTVLAMSATSVLRHLRHLATTYEPSLPKPPNTPRKRQLRHTAILYEPSIGIPLALSAAWGGVSGKIIFDSVLVLLPGRTSIGAIQSVILFVLTGATAVYSWRRSAVPAPSLVPAPAKPLPSPAPSHQAACAYPLCAAMDERPIHPAPSHRDQTRHADDSAPPPIHPMPSTRIPGLQTTMPMGQAAANAGMPSARTPGLQTTIPMDPAATNAGMPSTRIPGLQTTLVIGFALGLLSSFLGIGGGPFNLAVLYLFFGMDTKTASFYSITIVMASQAFNLIYTLLLGTLPDFPVPAAALMAACGISGGIFGSCLYQKLKPAHIDRLFLVLLIAIMCVCLYNVHRYGI
ncbi:MAG: TSUP family transporter [Lachnospiraceae bacterium]|jgi:uncharacterized membrane protein YfcA|nr:TSUP family transporter [Lachnospiraceae bacterium]